MDKKTIPLPKHLSPLQQMGASCSGAFMTSVFTTPFDVVKVTLQAQQKASQLAPVHNMRCLCELCICNVTVAGAGGQSITVATPRAVSGTWRTLSGIVTNEGPRQLWRGLSPTLAMAVPATIIYYTAYDNILEKMQFTDKGRTNYAIPAMCGGVARTLAVAAICPLEIIRTKKQAQAQYRYFELFRLVRQAVRSSGVFSLWRGLFPMMWRDVPFSAFYWALYERLKTQALLQGRNIKTSEAFLFGATAGSTAAFVTTPFDVVKTYWQVELGEANAVRVPMLSVMRRIFAEHGWQGLFVGVVPRVGKVAPACAIMISSYETSKAFFHQYNQKQKRYK